MTADQISTRQFLEWNQAIKNNELLNELFINDLQKIIQEYAEPTVCDLLKMRFPERYLLFLEVAPIGSRYGDWSAKWILSKDVVCQVNDGCDLEHGYECEGALVGCPKDNTKEFHYFVSDALEDEGKEDNVSECRILCRWSELASIYLCVSPTTQNYFVVGNNGYEVIGQYPTTNDAYLIDELFSRCLDLLINF